MSATHCDRWARPGKLSSALKLAASGSPAASPSASAARALAALWTPEIFMRLTGRMGSPRRARKLSDPRRTSVKSASARSTEKVSTRAGRAPPEVPSRIAMTWGSSTFNTIVAACSKIRCFARA